MSLAKFFQNQAATLAAAQKAAAAAEKIATSTESIAQSMATLTEGMEAITSAAAADEASEVQSFTAPQVPTQAVENTVVLRLEGSAATIKEIDDNKTVAEIFAMNKNRLGDTGKISRYTIEGSVVAPTASLGSVLKYSNGVCTITAHVPTGSLG